MVYAPTSTVFPSERRSLGIAKEAVAGTGVLPAYTVPVKGFVPEDKVMGLIDESLRSAMAAEYGYIQGPYVADVTIDQSPVYGDQFGHFLYNILGDYTATGTASGTIATTINFSAGYPVGTTGAIAVVSGGGFGAGYIQMGTAATAEIVNITSATGTSVTISGTTPTRLAHANGAAVAQVTGPYTHVFSLLNGTGNAQPPTHTLTDQNYINADQARWYPYFCASELTITGNAEQLLMWSGKGMGFANSTPSTIPTVNVSTVKTSPSWNSKVGLGGTVVANPIYQIGEWEYTITREVSPYFTANGQQNPFVIARGKLSGAGKWNFAPTIDETPLLELLNNTQPQTQVIATNGLGGTSVVNLQIDSQVTAFETSVIDPSKALLGYNDAFKCIANTTNTGNTAGFSPLQITLTNNTPTY